LEISAALVKELREKTQASVMDCKRALVESECDLNKAEAILKKHGITIAEKKATRTANKGAVDAYVHGGGRVGAMIELNCETDFVARNELFKELSHNLTLQIAAMAPEYISKDDLPEGKNLDPKVVCLLSQPFIKDEKRTVQEVITEAVAKLGENIKVRRFVRYELSC
jgi:elongation factor Ts